jgi:Ca-activated chloride channel family protein
VYAGAAGVVLPATKGNDQQTISAALDKLAAGGSTNGEQGIELAYQIAAENFKKGGINRVILATDGDFNVGTQSIDKLKELVASKRKTGIALTTLGFGQGNYNDGLMEQLANIGNGQHAYIDNINEARKVLVDELSSTMQIIAKDVKIQVEFNPQQVAEYRLIGYQNRVLANEDFNNDKVDAAELGAGHSVTALYEITLANAAHKQIYELRYQSKEDKKLATSNELAFVKVRYKQPDAEQSKLITQAVATPKGELPLSQASQDFKFAAAVAGFAQLLKGAKYIGDWQYEDCAKLATANKGIDTFGYRSEFVQLVNNAAAL